MSDLFVGLMSGTSMDGVDVAVADFSKVQPQVIGYRSFPYPAALKQTLNSLCASSQHEIVSMGHADRQVAECFAQATLALLEQLKLDSKDIAAIGSHGQTIRHHPQGSDGFTLQIGDPNTLAVRTGIDVIADFRKKDIALGGQGAPLAPAFHQALFRHSKYSRAVVNIGGIANITLLPADASEPVLGWDTGPGNTLMDQWCSIHQGQPFDRNGSWAASGFCASDLLKIMLSDPYFAVTGPKSTGREMFHLTWLQQCLQQLPEPISPQCVQSTLAMLTAYTIANQVNQLPQIEQVFICGGGANNEFLMECIESQLVRAQLSTTDTLGMDADALEAVAFAWLAYAHKMHISGNIPSVTGASRAAVLGGLYPCD